MTAATSSLWSPKIKPNILSPRQILNIQAAALKEQTKGVLVGELTESKLDENRILLTLNMVAPQINYRHQVLTAKHSQKALYPVFLDAAVFRAKPLYPEVSSAIKEMMGGKKLRGQADSDEELVKLVEEVLTSSEVVSEAQTMIALCNEARPRKNFVQQLDEMEESERESAIDEKIADTSHEILDSEEFASTSAETNATGWGIDDYKIEDTSPDGDECIVQLTYSASGDQEEDKMYSGDHITGNAKAVIHADGSVEYEEITAEVEHEVDEPDEPDGPDGPG